MNATNGPKCRECGTSLHGPLFLLFQHEPRCAVLQDELRALEARHRQRGRELDVLEANQRLQHTGLRVVSHVDR
jgi:hypothetical protein